MHPPPSLMLTFLLVVLIGAAGALNAGQVASAQEPLKPTSEQAVTTASATQEPARRVVVMAGPPFSPPFPVTRTMSADEYHEAVSFGLAPKYINGPHTESVGPHTHSTTAPSSSVAAGTATSGARDAAKSTAKSPPDLPETAAPATVSALPEVEATPATVAASALGAASPEEKPTEVAPTEVVLGPTQRISSSSSSRLRGTKVVQAEEERASTAQPNM